MNGGPGTVHAPGPSRRSRSSQRDERDRCRRQRPGKDLSGRKVCRSWAEQDEARTTATPSQSDLSRLVDPDVRRYWGRPQHPLHDSEFATHIALVGQGVAVGLLPRLGRPSLPESVVAVRVVDPVPTGNIRLIWRRTMSQSPAIRHLTAVLQTIANPGQLRASLQSHPAGTLPLLQLRVGRQPGGAAEFAAWCKHERTGPGSAGEIFGSGSSCGVSDAVAANLVDRPRPLPVTGALRRAGQVV